MRQAQSNRRGRGRSRKAQNPLTKNYESNGPDVKIRGTAAHISEKYTSLARDAQTSGDTVRQENYFQHAEHYNRIIAAAQQNNQSSAEKSDDQTSTETEAGAAETSDQQQNSGRNRSEGGRNEGRKNSRRRRSEARAQKSNGEDKSGVDNKNSDTQEDAIDVSDVTADAKSEKRGRRRLTSKVEVVSSEETSSPVAETTRVENNADDAAA